MHQLTRDIDANLWGFPIFTIIRETLPSTHSLASMDVNFGVDNSSYVKREDQLS